MAGHEDAFHVEMSWGELIELPPETDTGAVEAGYVSLTALSRIDDDGTVDLSRAASALAALPRIGSAR
jgi:5'-nucleotidase